MQGSLLEPILLASAAWSWSRESEAEVDPSAAAVRWSCRKGSDYWRITASGTTVHNGHACTVPVPGDFSIEGELSAKLACQYDQLGFVAIENESHWLKAGLELDGRIHAGAVHTRETSDWSLQPATLPAQIRLRRNSGTIEVSYRPAGGEWTMIRQLTLEGTLSVGFYAAAPLGPGFRASVSGLVFLAAP